MKYLISVTEIYRFDTEPEAEAYIKEQKRDGRFDLIAFKTERKDVKAKGEIVDSYYKVTLQKEFNDIKDPVEAGTSITYVCGE